MGISMVAALLISPSVMLRVLGARGPSRALLPLPARLGSALPLLWPVPEAPGVGSALGPGAHRKQRHGSRRGDREPGRKWLPEAQGGRAGEGRRSRRRSRMEQQQQQQLRSLRDFLLVYNQMTEQCFQRCVSNLNYRTLTRDEEACLDSCAGKLVRSNHRLMAAYVQLMPSIVQRRISDYEAASQVAQQEGSPPVTPAVSLPGPSIISTS
ncbi:mitochondrial import inner membrane translocase subunit Tim10 B [Rhineura floridana]|uniref:mitochondrial import inner membrane translocase subunit Tim10 B n=1 Tax=Rhineura floridana TaxID=261503 RepID=UPI002AC836C7|nr:mitochondrial import inner membrane translocase subunit Tim10 B [Rhineura floridana]